MKFLLILLLLLNLSACSNNEVAQPITEDKSQYTMYEVDACDLSGDRIPNAIVDIGYGDREYWAFTNEYGQLIKVEASEIILQNDDSESVTDKGRYCYDEAKVEGTEREDLDEGHIIADSLGGVSNAYNITPQDSYLNRKGEQSQMEETIRKAGGAKNFIAEITYPNTSTMIPSHYEYTYEIDGKVIINEFDNINLSDGENDISENLSNETYILNTNSKKIHKPDCESASKISEQNKKEYIGDSTDLINDGYEFCKICN